MFETSLALDFHVRKSNSLAAATHLRPHALHMALLQLRLVFWRLSCIYHRHRDQSHRSNPAHEHRACVRKDCSPTQGMTPSTAGPGLDIGQRPELDSLCSVLSCFQVFTPAASSNEVPRGQR